MDIAKFCPFCGKEQLPLEDGNNDFMEQDECLSVRNSDDTILSSRHNEITIEQKNQSQNIIEQGRNYNIGGYIITFDSNEIIYLDCYKMFHIKFLENIEKFTAYRRENISSLDDIVDKSIPAIQMCADSMVELGVDTLLRFSIDYIDKSMLKNELLQQYPIEEEFADVLKAFQSIERYAQQLNIESNSGMRFQGGGFGISGAISGAIKAEMLNVGMDALSGLGKMVTGNTDDDKMRRYKGKLFEEIGARNELNCLYHWCGGVFPIVYKILVREGLLSQVYFDEGKATAKFNNITRMIDQKQYDRDKAIIALLGGLKLNPLDVQYCEALLTVAPESFAELKRFTNDCGTYDQFADVADNIMEEYYKQQRIAQLKKYTTDKDVLDNPFDTVMNQSEMDSWYDKYYEKNGKSGTMYLIANEYRIPLAKKRMNYIGVGDVLAYIDSKCVIDFESIKVNFKNIKFNKDYSNLIESSRIYEEGIMDLVGRNHGEGIKKLVRARNMGNGTASSILGWIFENGVGVKKDDVKAGNFYNEWEKSGDVIGPKVVGLAYKQGWLDTEVNYKKAVFWLEKSEPSIEVFMELAEIYAKGLGGYSDKKKAVGLYEKAYKLGSYEALYEYAVLSDDSLKEKAKYFKEAAKHGVPEAVYHLGIMHWNYYKDVFQEDENDGYRIAVELFKKAAEKNIVDAVYRLGQAYMEGQGIPKSERLAANYFKKAAEQGHVDAMVEIGVCYANGTGIKQDYYKAVEFYRMAAQNGDGEAQLNLGICYQYGAGVEKNLDEAAHWYKLAVKQGNKEAQDMLRQINK